MIQGDHTMEGSVIAMQNILAAKARPTAAMCSNDLTAIGVPHAVYRAGLRVPDNFSVIGFDDIHVAEATIPPLSTFRCHAFDLARAAVPALKAEIEGHGEAIKHEFGIQTKLIVRKSTESPSGTMSRLRRIKVD